jgi:hypothetical protein
MSEQANESGENVPAIQSLIARAQDLGRSVSHWNNVYMILVAFTVVLAAGVFVAQFIVIKKGKLLADTQDELIAEKDRQSAADSKDKDLKISDAKRAAEEAKEHTAALEVEALKLRKELVMQGARENLLSGDNRQKLVDALKLFAGQKVDVRYSANAFMVNGAVVTATPLGDDSVGLANALVGVMKDAGWSLPPTALLYSVQGYGVNVEIVDRASPSTRAAAEALAKALRGVSLVVFGPQVISTDRAQRVGTAAQALSPPLDENTIILGVLTHPK